VSNHPENYSQIKKSKDSELEALRKELADRKEQHAKETSAAQLEIEDLRKATEESIRRCEDAVTALKATQDEIAEAKIVQKYNAQLHKDLHREQLARKKLHNEMEDLKGKIRVYVRIRPFSKTEKEKSCQEAVIKDGKMTVMVKGLGGVADAKKFYDFDAVFSGSPADGNSQEDIFKDTRHLMMSVVDGYNVCIFAYGQTGAGKSFTMIGAADIGNCLSEQGEFDSLAGITPRAVSELFRLLNER
jgi:predicted RNase H-like nuclease (RuvC/YqgF family)